MDFAGNGSEGPMNPYRPQSSYQEPPRERYAPSAPLQRRMLVPLLLFVATCYTTFLANGLVYAATVMFILTSHELGHFFQAMRYRVPASFPYFLPMPGSPIGTMGAVIAMGGRIPNRRALFDIGISGPLAGLVPTLIFCVVGLKLSQVGHADGSMLGESLLFKFMIYCIHGPLQPNQAIDWHPIAFAGWVGMFITALNLIPIGQLDGGHVLYAILRRGAYPVAIVLLALAVLGMVVSNNWGWGLMIGLLAFMGPFHPPTADDEPPLGTGRTILGWLTLCFVVLGFTPNPF
jgi:membrane-associated protease RseP (regulator of RpoE activity)